MFHVKQFDFKKVVSRETFFVQNYCQFFQNMIE